jgi:hypothetical protein
MLWALSLLGASAPADVLAFRVLVLFISNGAIVVVPLVALIVVALMGFVLVGVVVVVLFVTAVVLVSVKYGIIIDGALVAMSVVVSLGLGELTIAVDAGKRNDEEFEEEVSELSSASSRGEGSGDILPWLPYCCEGSCGMRWSQGMNTNSVVVLVRRGLRRWFIKSRPLSSPLAPLIGGRLKMVAWCQAFVRPTLMAPPVSVLEFVDELEEVDEGADVEASEEKVGFVVSLCSEPDTSKHAVPRTSTTNASVRRLFMPNLPQKENVGKSYINTVIYKVSFQLAESDHVSLESSS